ncbi:MAG TPA: FtsX-like permease family protein [Terriglobales bacterium]|nr:FtsX-like permease family protein [Terriglobales bacterium]
MNRMILANLVHRPMRSLISIVAIAVEVTLILLIVGLSLGMLNDSKTRQQGIGADVMVQPPGSSFLSGISGAPASVKIADKLRQLPHVKVVSPVITQITMAGAVEVVMGIDLDSFQQLGGPFHFISGGPFQAPNDVIVDDYYASGRNIKVGSTIEILNNPFRVCGIVEHGKGARKFLPLRTLQDLIGAHGKASIFYVKLDDPAYAPVVTQEMRAIPGMQSYVVRSMQEYLSMMTPGNLPGLSQFITVVIAVAVIIGFIVIFQAMYTAVMERTREIGILKSMGASKLYIMNVILRETLLLSIAGILLGIALSFAARRGIATRFPTLPIQIDPRWISYAIAIAVGGAILGALYPAFKAAQKDPIEALAYE